MHLELDLLNAPQRQAVLHEGGPLVVFAGAGSGKTRVITQRIGLLLERGVAPWRICAVTFTNKAASEMRERLMHITDAARDLKVGTFHSTCARYLRRYAKQVGVRSDFTIYDDADQKAMIKRVLGDMGLDIKRFNPKHIAHHIGKEKQEMRSPDDAFVDSRYDEVVARVYKEYEKKMAQAGALDFGDLIYRFARALEANDELRREVSGRLLHLLVDEFQDTNHAQLRLVHALASEHRNLTVVGDDDQSIYRWRGADRRNILDFRAHYPSAEVIKLEQNYRSSARILRVAHAVIRRNLDREPKEMWTDNDEGEKIFVVKTGTEREEALLVVSGVQELQNKGEELESIAVFYRTHAQSRVIEEALLRADIAYRIVGGLRFYDRAEVKDLLAYMRLLHNRDDDVSLLRIINTPTRGIGKGTIEHLLNRAAEEGTGVWGVIQNVENDARFSGRATKALASFREFIEGLESRGLPLDELPLTILEETEYLARLRAEGTAESDARIENLQELVGSVQEFSARESSRKKDATLAAFLEEVTLQTDVEQDEFEDKLTLMTVHAAKGLEFDTVMVVGMEEGMFPMQGSDVSADAEELEEERRLAYVAFTRARHRLILSFAALRRIYGQVRPGDASRFLLEIPKDDAHWIGVEPRAPQRDRWGRASRSGASAFGSRGNTSRNPGFGRDASSFVSRQQREAEALEKARAEKQRASAESGQSYIEYDDDIAGGQIHPGMIVSHEVFGEGTVISVAGGSIPKATVLFSKGKKTIATSYLRPA